MNVGKVKKSRDRATGQEIPGQYYLRISQDANLKKGDILSLFPINVERIKEVVASGKLSEEAAENIIKNDVYDVVLKVKQ